MDIGANNYIHLSAASVFFSIKITINFSIDHS